MTAGAIGSSTAAAETNEENPEITAGTVEPTAVEQRSADRSSTEGNPLYASLSNAEDGDIVVCDTAQEVQDAVSQLNGNDREPDDPGMVNGVIQLKQKRYLFDEPIGSDLRGIYIRGPHWNQLRGKNRYQWENCILDFSALDEGVVSNDPSDWPYAIVAHRKECASSFGLEGIQIEAEGRVHGPLLRSVGSITFDGVSIDLDRGDGITCMGAQDFAFRRTNISSGHPRYGTVGLKTRDDPETGHGCQGWVSGEISSSNTAVDHRSHRLFLKGGDGTRTRLNMSRAPDDSPRRESTPALYNEARLLMSDVFFSSLKNTQNAYALHQEGNGSMRASGIRVYYWPSGGFKFSSHQASYLHNVYFRRIGGDCIHVDGSIPQMRDCKLTTGSKIDVGGRDAVHLTKRARNNGLVDGLYGCVITSAGRHALYHEGGTRYDTALVGRDVIIDTGEIGETPIGGDGADRVILEGLHPNSYQTTG